MGNCFRKEYADEDDSDYKIFMEKNVQFVKDQKVWEEKISEARREGKTVVANFSASWCGPCRVMAPYYSELSEMYPSLVFLVIDVDEMNEFSSTWDIHATPTFFFLKDGVQVADKLVGANKPELLTRITSLVDSRT
ncbi:Thioredoxin H-type [Nymphaea thermarum]|nr:Thioredoxin H-type [Nymphaea thermarum]